MRVKYANVRKRKQGFAGRTCVGCRIEKRNGDRRRARTATWTAERQDDGFVLPLAFCDEHWKMALSEGEGDG